MRATTITRRACRALAFLLGVLLLAIPLAACRGDEEDASLPTGGIRLTVTAPKDDAAPPRAVLAASLGADVLHAHAGQAVRVYELAPGETVSDTAGKTPVAQGELSARLRLEFDLSPTGLYASYALLFSDGTALGAPVSLSNPEALASGTAPFPHDNTVKGLLPGMGSAPDPSGDDGGASSDPWRPAADLTALTELAHSLYATHLAVELDLPALLAGSGAQAVLGDTALELDAAHLAYCDAQMAAAAATGAQVTLILQLNADAAALPLPSYAALLDMLCARYAPSLTAIILRSPTPRTAGNSGTLAADASHAASLYCLSHLALRARVAQGRVYLAASGTRDDTLSYLLAAGQAVPYPFGAALEPAPAVASMSEAAGAPFCLSDLYSMSRELTLAIRGARICVSGLAIPAADPGLQAALYTYAYRAARTAKADMLLYESLVDEATGLYGADRLPRPAARAFATADSGENAEGETLAEERLGDDWRALAAIRPERLAVWDAANLGTTGDPGERWLDFSGGGDHGFGISGSGVGPTLVDSAALGTRVLSATLMPTLADAGSGMRCSFPNGEALGRAYVLSASLLAQSPVAGGATVSLRLDGTATDGRALTYTASTDLICNEWQLISFHIRNFTSQMDASSPVSLTLSLSLAYDTADGAAPDASVLSAPYALLLHSFNTRAAAPDLTPLWVTLLVLGGFALGFFAVFLPARRRKKHRMKHGQ